MAGEKAPIAGRIGAVLPVLPPLFALVELAIFAAVIVAEWAWDPFPDLTKLNPHPYWLPVLLISLQYGTVSGFLAATLAIGGTGLIGLPEQDIGESYFGYLVRAWTQPVLWMIVALLLGAFRMRQIEQRDDLLQRVDELEEQERVIEDHAKTLQVRCERLEREFVSRAKPETNTLLDALAALGRGDSKAAVDAALEAAFPGAQASVFARAGDRLQLVHAHNWPAATRSSTVFSAGDGITQAVLGEARSLSVLRAGDERLLAGEGTLAVPILDHTKVPIGMLKVESLVPSAIGPATIDRLVILAHHLAHVLPALAIAANGGTQAPILRPAGVVVPKLIRRPVAVVAAHAVADRDVVR